MTGTHPPRAKHHRLERTSEKKAGVVKYFSDKELSDVCLIIGNTEFHVHKMPLALQSNYFKALFYGNFKEKNQDRIEIHDVDPVVFEWMLDIIYGSKFKNKSFFSCGEKTDNTSKIFWEEVGNLWAIADRFDVPRLKRRVDQHIHDFWCPADEDEVDRCSFCINRYAFCIVNGIRAPEDLHYRIRTIRKWAEKHFDGVPETIASIVMKEVLLKMSPK